MTTDTRRADAPTDEAILKKAKHRVYSPRGAEVEHYDFSEQELIAFARDILAAPPVDQQAAASNQVYVEVRQCDRCDHIGINDGHDADAACHTCEWSGPSPVEDKCPGCGNTNCMGIACPKCSALYTLLADGRFLADEVSTATPASAGERAAFEIVGATAALQECVDAADAWHIISDAEDAEDIDPIERTMAASRRVAAFESARKLLARRTSSPAASTTVAPLDDARKCLMDVLSHHDDFEKACRALKDAASDDGNGSEASYWLDRIDVLGRIKTQAEHALTAVAQPIPAPRDSAGAEFESWIATLLGVGEGEQFRDRICTAIKTLKVRASYATETCVEGVRPVPPRWYSRDEIVHALKNMNYHETIALELADWFVRHLQLAFNKGFEKGARTPVQAAPVAIPAHWALVPGDPVHQQLTAICQSYWGDGWDDEDMRGARLVDAREMYKAAINSAPQPPVTSPSDEG